MLKTTLNLLAALLCAISVTSINAMENVMDDKAQKRVSNIPAPLEKLFQDLSYKKGDVPALQDNDLDDYRWQDLYASGLRALKSMNKIAIQN